MNFKNIIFNFIKLPFKQIMSLVSDTSYKPWMPFKNKHFNTIYRTLSSKFKVIYRRKRLQTPDNDFIDLDIASVKSNNVVIVIHGLEGSAQSAYVLAVAHFLNTQAVDVIAVNLRGCSGEDNKHIFAYHSGFTSDLNFVIQQVIKGYSYQTISLLGYSLGGNMVLKYMGEYADSLPLQLKCAVGVSAPCDLEDSSNQLAKKSRFLYMNSFLKSLKKKALLKFEHFPNFELDKNRILNARNFADFDDAFTAPIFGYKSALDYWTQNSCKQFLPLIKKPTLLITALDDPFLSDKCYPFLEAKNHPHFDLLATKYGGHVGFNCRFNKVYNLWCERQLLGFIEPHFSHSQ